MSAFRAVVRRQLVANRTSMLVMAGLWAVNDVAQVTSYQSLFPDPHTRLGVLSGFTSNGALRALYGYPFDIGSPTGWLAWRAMGFVVMVMAMWAAIVVTGALRGEEESGRAEMTLGHPISRGTWFMAALTAILIESLVICGANIVALDALCVTRGLMTVVGTLEIGLQLFLPALLFGALGAVVGQLLGTVRGARIAVASVLVIAFLLRTAADAGNGVPWLRWITPLGWFEELRPPAAPSPAALTAIVISAAVLLALALRLFAVRDVGAGLLPRRDARQPWRLLLGGHWQAALRDELPQLAAWTVASVLVMALMGSLTRTILELAASRSRFRSLLGPGFALDAYVAAIFSLVQLVVALLVVTVMVGARGEEASGRLEVLLATPLSRHRWLGARAALASGAALLVAVLCALSFWIGGAITGRGPGLGSVLVAALNCIPLILVAVGVATTILAMAPRTVASVYAAVAIAYLWGALGTAFHAPGWSLDISPFHWLAPVPAQAFAVLPAAALTAGSLALLALALSTFRHRDLAAG